MTGLKKGLLSQGFHPDTSDKLISSWRQGTRSNYSQYINEWFKFSMLNNISPFESHIQVTLAFLTSLIKKGKSYYQILTARSDLAKTIFCVVIYLLLKDT